MRRQRRRFGFLRISAAANPKRRRATLAAALQISFSAACWKRFVPPFLRLAGAPVLYQDKLYVPISSVEEVPGADEKYECCKFRGAIVALDAYTGKLLWKNHSIQEPLTAFKKNAAGTQQYGPAGGAIWSAPTLDLKRKVIYAATGNSYTDADTKGADAIIAFDLETGKIKWSKQVTPKDNYLVSCWPKPTGNCPSEPGPDVDFGSSPILRTLPNGKQVILAGQKSGVVYRPRQSAAAHDSQN